MFGSLVERNVVDAFGEGVVENKTKNCPGVTT